MKNNKIVYRDDLNEEKKRMAKIRSFIYYMMLIYSTTV